MAVGISHGCLGWCLPLEQLQRPRLAAVVVLGPGGGMEVEEGEQGERALASMSTNTYGVKASEICSRSA